ncbi:hypothetical protein L6452_11015 [Arctium lappa]|uniref:Uncharacterized protein n=1 Tax=Arctium lappa TaxID=4217 RepID=A0ACB9DP92_ARCLA|nr:hypothetical protein L6452_11015 [Arctium lappa]
MLAEHLQVLVVQEKRCALEIVGLWKLPTRLQFIANNVGDNLGDIARMDSDNFGLYVESTYAALVASISSFGMDHGFTLTCYPLFTLMDFTCNESKYINLKRKA